jgi:nucleotide-binding universal stress UspA family protein
VTKRADHARSYQSRYRTHAGFILANAIFAAVFVALALAAFHAPAPHEVPVGIVAPAAATGQVEKALAHGGQDAFDLLAYPNAASARAAVARRVIDGALVIGRGDPRLLIARGGGTGPAQALTQVFGVIAARTGQSLTVTDIAAPLTDDSEALSPFFVILGVLFPSLAAGSASAFVYRRARPAWSVAAPVVIAVIVGLIAAGVADGLSGLGNYAAIASIVALFSLAVGACTAMLGRIWPPLVSVAVLIFIVLGLPASGGPGNLGSFGPALLRVLHPALPLGAAADAVRGTVYFDGYGTAGPVWVLAAWAAAGMIGLIIAVAFRRTAAVRVLPHAAHHSHEMPVPPAALTIGQASVQPAALADPALAPSVVIGFDNSEPARRALAWTARLAASRAVVLHVIYADHVSIDSDLSGRAYAEMMAARDEAASAIEQAAADILAGTDVSYTFERRQGVPADVILAEAAARTTETPDASGPVIVVGQSGRAAHHVLGSVPVRLLHRSPYPVLAIP